MTHLDDYSYDLPPELIAQEPLVPRSDARLLVVNRSDDSLSHAYVRDLPEILRPGDLLVLNDTRVVPARLVGYRGQTRGRWEGLYLGDDGHGTWSILGKTRGKIRAGEDVMLVGRDGRDHTPMRLLQSQDSGQWLARPKTSLSPRELLDEVGRVPLPHYIRDGEMTPSDIAAYQTVFARLPGSVAAPTAGLHFTPDLLGQLQSLGIGQAMVTLHVGVGTFRPITAAKLEDHRMHAEWGSVSGATANRIQETRQRGGRVIAVGTTTVRLLESAFAAVGAAAWEGTTDLFIRPPYQFHCLDGLLTNFHLPRSTLLILVRTFGGDALIRRAYELAIQEQYRFFSYGDAMLII